MNSVLRLIVLLSVSLVTSFGMSGQGNGKNWYKQDNRYFKFVISEAGIYRITAKQLREAGFPIDEVPGDRIQLFTLGEEQALNVSTQSVFEEADYIEFYGKGNDGEADAFIYENPQKDQLNPRYSLYTDERPYFLSWVKDGQEPVSPNRYNKKGDGLNVQGIPPKEATYMHRIDTVFHDFHFKPTHDGRNYIRYSNMDVGEGYGSHLRNETDLNFSLEGMVLQSQDVRLKLRLGTNILSRSLSFFANDFAIKNVTQVGFGTIEIDQKIDRQLITDDHINLKIKGLTGQSEKHSLAFVELLYPRAYDFMNRTYMRYVQQPSIISRYVEIQNVGVGPDSTATIYNLDQKYCINARVEGGKVRFVAPASYSFDNNIFVTDIGIREVTSIQEVVIDPQILASDYLILTHPKFINDGALAYAQYRSSPEGGGYSTKVVDVTRIYDAYGYGIEGHVLGIKNYFQDLRNEGLLPRYILLIGKGLEYSEIRANPSIQSLIPTFGVPGSDNLLVWGSGPEFPDVAIGRLAVSENDEIRHYLQKIYDHENPKPLGQSIDQQRWKKSFVHLSGGSADIQELLFGFLTNMENIISYNKFGAEVTTFRKTSADPIQRTMTDQIIQRINDGAAMITFFGHSAVGTFDFSLEDPSKYENGKKNPVILSLGCHSGNIHTSFPGVSEEFVLEEEKGAIAFIASSGTAFPGPQYQVGSRIYELMGSSMYGKSIGEILYQVIRERTGIQNIEEKTLAQQLTLHGDPAYRYHIYEGPDYVLDYSSVKVSPELLNSSTDKITLRFDVVNLGTTIESPLDIRVIHQIPSEKNVDTTDITIPSPAFRATVEMEFDNPGPAGIGVNRFFIEVDHENRLEEFPKDEAENNNQLTNSAGEIGYRFFVLDNSARPIYPANYAIVNHIDKIRLISAINNALSPGGTFVIQIDTSALFQSDQAVTTEMENTSSTIEWIPKLAWEPGRVYYWRIRPKADDVLNNKNNVWKTSSFIYLPGTEEGWNQSHYYQWLNNSFYKLFIDDNRRLQYDRRNWDIRIKNEIGDPSDFWVFVNNTPWSSLNPKEQAPALAIFAWNENDVIVQNNGGDFGSLPYSSDGFVFNTNTPEERQNIKHLLDFIPTGSRVFVHTILSSSDDDLNTADWASDKAIHGFDLFEEFEKYGAVKIRNLESTGTVPYTFIFDKGIGPVVEDIANGIEESVDLSATATSFWQEGKLTSVNIGPVDRWMRLKWKETKEENDKSTLEVYGIGTNGVPKLLKEVVDDYDVNLTSINPGIYPFIRLQYSTEDPEDKSSPQLDHWRIIYTALPDPALYSDQLKFAIDDTVNAGQDLMLHLEIRNISDAYLEPVLIRYTLTDEKNHTSVFVRRAEAVAANGATKFTESIPTYGLSGLYKVDIEINPGGEIREVTDCNNFGFTYVYIRPDQQNPLLDVTFDGRHIRDGEIIAPQPKIKISLVDENAFVLLDDSTIFDVNLYYPGFLRWKAKPGDKGVTFIPATDLSENVAHLMIQPNLNVQGIYTLEVQARDIAGNNSGKEKYRVSFEVGDFDKEQAFRVFPNPIQTETTFEYFVEPSRVPDVFFLKIYTTDGKEVRTLTKTDFGGISAGINRYIWDGTGTSGFSLPNGLYYYELITNTETKSKKHRGSLIIMR